MHSLSRPSCRCLWSLTKQGFVIIHWLYLFDLSPLCVFKCVLKWSAREMFDCVISNVSSNDFCARMQSHIGNICLIFFHCTMLFRKKRAKNDNCLRRCKVSLFAFISFFSTEHFQMSTQITDPHN